MKSMLFILVAQLHSGAIHTVAAYPSLGQVEMRSRSQRQTSLRTTRARRHPWRVDGRQRMCAT